ncbi:nuclear transport factor 2 family protein [Prolixibacter denitrificans]|uniref:Steroid delta-isomerase-like uncharacterized protein n=1 Tax=Prolixibacter denitrificans TaxID=1541063 RepID=A0A2P8CF78_9BACT|nr:nuclear transport factor 2 family protein [Prolixibacter denitrificans]PSK83643.1 steroid delta-isomerase-like uncharacterized protein [Prolixibacter denitrificans]GET23191.1 hypothetical protein JCM18694_34370 [Prolixibacter denitrificans]
MKRKISFPIAVVILMFLFGCNESSQKIRDNEALAKAALDAWSSHDSGNLTALFADSCLYEEVATGRKFNTKRAIADYFDRTIAGVPDSDFEIVDVIASENMAMVEWVWTGTNTVGWANMNIPATNKHFEVRGVSVMDIENNRISKNRDYWDWNTFLKGIGVE